MTGISTFIAASSSVVYQKSARFKLILNASFSILVSRKERRQWTNPNHIIPSMAETRAKSRAISDLLGVGDAKE